MKEIRTLLGTSRCGLSVLLAVLLAAQPALAESAGPVHSLRMAAPVAADDTSSMTITILDGEGALNNIRERTAREPIVQVTDANHKPIAGATVLFRIVPGPNGAGGAFNGAQSLTVQTDAEGKAIGQGLKPNTTQGEFQIEVTANFAAMTASTIIHQTNQKKTPGAKGAKPPSHKLAEAGIVAAAIVIAIIIGIRSSNYGHNDTTITIGGGTVGPPSTTRR